MRSRSNLKSAIMIAAALMAAGCLVSEEPILNASNSDNAPIEAGRYQMCSLEEESDPSDCELFTVEPAGDGEYRFVSDEDPEDMLLRFSRLGGDGYAVQTYDDGAYIYFYGGGDSDRFLLTLMMCEDLPEELRARLIADGDMELDDSSVEDDKGIETCIVRSLKGLKEAAGAYHRGEIASDELEIIEFTLAD